MKLRLEEMELALPGVVDQEAVEAQEEEEEGLAGWVVTDPGLVLVGIVSALIAELECLIK